MALNDTPERAYNSVRDVYLAEHPDRDLLSLAVVKKVAAKMSGIYPIVKDMCPNSCAAYTGEYADLEKCPECDEDRYEEVRSAGGKRVPRQTFYTMPLGPQLQMLYNTTEGADLVEYRKRRMAEIICELEESGGVIKNYDDVFYSQEYLDAVQRGDIQDDDIVLMFSMDGAQLYCYKQSDCWIDMYFLHLSSLVQTTSKTATLLCFLPSIISQQFKMMDFPSGMLALGVLSSRVPTFSWVLPMVQAVYILVASLVTMVLFLAAFTAGSKDDINQGHHTTIRHF
ncbi:hypothetical protein H0H81_006289 [Sphagnurus paluster]|uniref:Uncharacterized protein n=1 Tax=Sphagnurus paluster TaxID=117069 RepID=A0A9P7FP53_9AGAR|nr:hypothetical protein H0H81_006289 [Sphagnurus paluster]